MSQFRKTYLLLSLLILLTACVNPYKCGIGSQTDKFYYPPIVHLADNAPVLYSSEFDIMKYRFTGLIAFRQMPEEEEIRIAFLSETGLRIMEFNYKEHEMNNTYCIPPVDKKRVKKFIGNFLLMLIENPECQTSCIEKTDEKSTYFCKIKNIKLQTETIDNQKTHACINIKNNRACGTYTDSEFLPEKITVTMSQRRIRINLTRVDNAFE